MTQQHIRCKFMGLWTSSLSWPQRAWIRLMMGPNVLRQRRRVHILRKMLQVWG